MPKRTLAVLSTETGTTRSVSGSLSGKRISRGFSCSNASPTVHSGSVGWGRDAITVQMCSRSSSLPRARSVICRPAKKPVLRSRIERSTPPLSVGVRTRASTGFTLSEPASSTRPGCSRAAPPWRSSTTVLALSKSHWRVDPPRNVIARTSERRSDSAVRSRTSSAYRIREYAKYRTKTHRARKPPATAMRPTCPQSICACSPGSRSHTR